MGCEGYITIQKVVDGDYLIHDDMPIFRVAEPVAIIPYHIEIISGIKFREAYDLNHVCSQMLAENSKAIDLSRYWGILVMPRRIFNILRSNDSEVDKSICAVPQQKHFDVWQQITPGYWAITNYYGTGHDDDDYLSTFILRPEIRLDSREIHWELWT